MMKELLLYMVLIIAIQFLSFSKISNNDLKVYFKANEFLIVQSKAIKDMKKQDFNYNLYVNYLGNVNQAKTIEFKNKSLLIRLGSGSVKIK